MKTALRPKLESLMPEQRRRRRLILELLGRALRQVIEQPDGFALRFATGSSTWMIVAEFVNLERLCAPFLTFVLERQPENGFVWLRVTGAQGIKDFVLEHWQLWG
jgi:hypothetical protein